MNVSTHQSVQTKKIIQYLLREKGKTILEISDFCGLSLPTTTKFLNELIEQNILTQSGKKESSGGRPPSFYALNPDRGYIIGVELLLKSFRMSIINLNQEVIYEYETDNFDISQQEETFDFLVEIVPDLLAKQAIPKEKILGVGIGITGRVDRDKGISYSYLNFAEPLTVLLEKHWGYPVFIDNDTHFMTLGEQVFGLARKKQNVIYVNFSRGLAIGIISNGMIHQGHSGFAGEFGHISYFDNDKLCICGKKGCLSTVVSGASIEEAYFEKTGKTLHYREILLLSKRGDKIINEILSDTGEQLGKALSMLIQIFNPELLIFGGRIVEVGEFLKYSIIRGISLHSLPQLMADCEFQFSSLGEKAEMLGAFALVMDKFFEQ
ncbi:Sugar kinase of the NBD/HSP70 family, may contain an N-terminal HTH domain [Pseudarcicella hirudinis]|uniref:Sugar kinase of the NBD/HSP70 family, may contain an N-terminal HTH domain n=2 Tax=Pseudarcicella hirudinis TaxID=1079859 RepID=A0A1I5VFW9_9BACT|nr:Sugar kinase of the NBD/HSP70 family, may contain an N-terminal HTH domain [Pseudarcicella hirudinis]